MRSKWSFHDPLYSKAHALNMSSKVWMVQSVRPLVAKAVLINNLLPNASRTFFQKFERNCESLSDTILVGTPCNRMTCLTYALARASTLLVSFMGMNLAVLVNLFTITHIVLLPPRLLGKATTKSMDIESHFHVGISRGWIFS